jgi:hypothetical protein
MGQSIRVWGNRGWIWTYNERPQVHPAITKQEPDITGNPKTTCCAADSNRGTSGGIDFEDGI